jgi:DNA-binding response OmpR family regulator
MQILLVEDDRPLALSLTQALAARGYVVNPVDRGRLALNTLLTEPPDIIILDLGLPDMDGLEVLKGIRKHSRTLPVLVLTARSSTNDLVAGLDRGADDYLAKPFEITELLARLRVLERRLGTSGTSTITVGQVSLNTAHLEVSRDGEPLELSRREYMLLKALMENAGKVLTRASLESRLYSWGEEVASNALEVHIHHLRRKLGADFIHTVRGVGYRVAAG